MPRIRIVKDGVEDDTEGNMPRVKVPAPEVAEDDTEGQGFRMGVSDGVEDDTEGNGLKKFHVEDGTDDTEGNAFRH